MLYIQCLKDLVTTKLVVGVIVALVMITLINRSHDFTVHIAQFLVLSLVAAVAYTIFGLSKFMLSYLPLNTKKVVKSEPVLRNRRIKTKNEEPKKPSVHVMNIPAYARKSKGVHFPMKKEYL